VAATVGSTPCCTASPSPSCAANADAQRIFTASPNGGHTKKEWMRVLKRQLSNVVYRH
jgi:hypothetical protein